MDAETKEMFELVLSEMRTRLTTVDKRFDAMAERLDVMEFRNDARHDRLVQAVAAGWVRSDENFERLSEKIDKLRNETYSNFDSVFRRVDRLDTEYAAIIKAVRDLERERDETN